MILIGDSFLHEDGRLTIALPIPHSDVSPNARRGESKWAAVAKSRKVKAHRLSAYTALRIALRNHKLNTKWAGYSLAFFFKTSAFRDDDNADGSCKAYRDGFAQALRMDDKRLRKLQLSTQAKDAHFPRVEITLYPVCTADVGAGLVSPLLGQAR